MVLWQPHQLQSFEKKIHYQFADIQLLKQALTHRSAKGLHNERLEYLGDSILGFVIAAELYRLFPDSDEGQLTRMRSQLVKENTLAEIAIELDLSDLLKLGGGELKSGGYRRASILSDAFEAVLGAIFLDSDIDQVKQTIVSIYSERMKHLSPEKVEKDPKTQLQEWLQGQQRKLPEYRVERTEGKDHNRIYWVDCDVDQGFHITQGSGTSRRKAEQAAAKNMLVLLIND